MHRKDYRCSNCLSDANSESGTHHLHPNVQFVYHRKIRSVKFNSNDSNSMFP